MVGTFKTVKSAACVAIAVLVVSGTVAAQSADMTAALRLGRAMAKDTAEINRQEKACRDAVYASAEFAHESMDWSNPMVSNFLIIAWPRKPRSSCFRKDFLNGNHAFS